MRNFKQAFTMIELVFVIVVLGVLAAIAVPKFAANRTDAQMAKARASIASIRSSIVSERQVRLIKGDNKYINKLHSSDTTLFDGNGTSELLMYGIKAKDEDGHWQTAPTAGTGSATGKEIWVYEYKILSKTNKFTYTQEKGTFLCTDGDFCPKLTD